MEETMIESTDNVTFVINGEKVLVPVHASLPFEWAVKRALRMTQNILRPFEEWEITHVDGSPKPVANATCNFTTRGQMFFINPKIDRAQAAQRPK